MLHWDHPQVRELIRLAVAEDVGSGDVTTEACVPRESQSVGYFLPKQDLTLAGTELLRIIFPQEKVEILESDGTHVLAGQVLCQGRRSDPDTFNDGEDGLELPSTDLRRCYLDDPVRQGNRGNGMYASGHAQDQPWHARPK